MNLRYTHEELEKLILSLVGDIEPVGETNFDNNALENLRTICLLTSSLLDKINDVRRYQNNYQFSMKTAGECAERFMYEIKEDFAL
jgi:hypothetical protein